MKIQLILPPLTESGNGGLLPRFAPYITASVAAHLRKTFVSVRIFDAFLKNASFQNIILEINKYHPDIIGVPLVEVNREVPLEASLSMIQYLKANNHKNIIVAFGSKHIEFIRSYLEKNDGIDYYIAGDPEEIMLGLIEALNKNDESCIRATKGLVYKNKNEIVFTGERILEDLDRLEFPAWDLVDLTTYSLVPHRYRSIKFYPLTSTRGCSWNKCVFCQDDASITKYPPYRLKSPRRVTEEIIYAYEKYGSREIQFYDQHFNTDKEWLLQLESEFKKNKINISWSCLSRIDLVNPEVLSIMRRMGCWNILFGIESCCEHLLKIMNKGISLVQIENAVRWCKNEGIEITGSFLLGIPGEKPRDIFDTVSVAHRIGIDYAQFFIAKWIKEHDEFKHAGHLMDQWDFPQHDFCGRIFVPNGYRDLRHLKNVQRLAYFKFYLHPKIIARHIRKVNNIEGLKRMLNASRILLRLLKK